MSGTAIDTNVLLDLLVPESEAGERSVRALDAASERGPLVIGPVTYAELAAHFARARDDARGLEDLDLFLEQAGIRLEPLPSEAASTAGRTYAKHLGERRATEMECPRCGHRQRFLCSKCAAPVEWRQHILTDFLIGAHALHTTGVLLTRDRHLHKKIPGLKLLSP